jgi:hypothetical protein
MNTIKNANTIEAAAHHEAGHAAIMYRFWSCIGEGGITTDLFTPGNGNVASRLEVFFKGQSDRMRGLGDTVWRAWRKKIEWGIIMDLAGPLAELRYLNSGRSPAGALFGCSRDIERVRHLIEVLDPLAGP